VLPPRQLFAATATFVPRSLVSEAAADTLATIIAALPDLGSECGFECRLGPDLGPVDLGIGIRRNDAEAVARLPTLRQQLDAIAAKDAGWEGLARFLGAWNDRSGPLWGTVPFIFLEVDADAGAAVTPSVFIALDWPLGGAGADEAASRVAVCAAVQEAVSRLGSPALAAACRSQLTSAFEWLDRDARIFHVGVMLGRRPAAIRLSVSAGWRDLPAYLRRLGALDGSAIIERLHGIMSPVIHPDALQQCDFDLPASAGVPLGFAFPLVAGAEAAPLLQHLVAQGLCTQEQRAALLAWSGEATVSLPFGGLECRLRRYLSHVKLSCDASGRCGAKVYFGVAPHRLTPAESQPNPGA
jgi:hypothetical protein